MRLNGLYAVIDLAVRELEHPLVQRYRDALVLGSLREDVWYLPGGAVVEHWSFSHFYRPGKPGGLIPFLWPGPRHKGELFYGRAVAHARAGRLGAGFVQLGRVLHLLTDMCCPVHAHRTVHLTDPFEWAVEGNLAHLLTLPVPAQPEVASASQAIEAMARYTQRHATDPTNNALGQVMRQLGRWKPVNGRLAREQAFDLIPVCAGHAVALLRLYLRQVGALDAPARAAG